MIQSICLVRLSALGDVLMFVPLVRTLQQALPDATLTWIISRPAYDLVAGMAGVEFIVIDKPQSALDYWRFKQQMKSRVFDVLLAAQASLRANLLYPCIRARRKIGYDRARAKDGHRWFVKESIAPGRDHTLDGFLKFAAALGVSERVLRWDLPVMEADEAWVREQLNDAAKKPILVVNPAASQAERNWPTERLVEVIRQIQANWSMTVVLTGGPAAHEKVVGELIAAKVPVINWIGQTKPKQLLALIRLATLVICPDTGPSHMAAAVGTPVVALHAVTGVGISGPYTYRDYAVDAYPEALRVLMGKEIGDCPWGTQVHGGEAMNLISVDAVMAQVQRILR